MPKNLRRLASSASQASKEDKDASSHSGARRKSNASRPSVASAQASPSSACATGAATGTGFSEFGIPVGMRLSGAHASLPDFNAVQQSQGSGADQFQGQVQVERRSGGPCTPKGILRQDSLSPSASTLNFSAGGVAMGMASPPPGAATTGGDR